MLTVLRKGSGLSRTASCILISVAMIKTTYPTWSKALNPLIHYIEAIVLKCWTPGNPFFHTAFFDKCLVKPVNVAGLFVESSVFQFLMYGLNTAATPEGKLAEYNLCLVTHWYSFTRLKLISMEMSSFKLRALAEWAPFYYLNDQK